MTKDPREQQRIADELSRKYREKEQQEDRMKNVYRQLEGDPNNKSAQSSLDDAKRQIERIDREIDNLKSQL